MQFTIAHYTRIAGVELRTIPLTCVVVLETLTLPCQRVVNKVKQVTYKCVTLEIVSDVFQDYEVSFSLSDAK